MNPVTAILIHVSDPAEGLLWYGKAFPEAVASVSLPSGFEFLRIGDISSWKSFPLMRRFQAGRQGLSSIGGRRISAGPSRICGTRALFFIAAR